MGYFSSNFSGLAKNLIIGSKIYEDVYLELDLKNKRFLAFLKKDKGFINNDLMKNVGNGAVLRDVIIFTPSLFLSSEEIKELFIISYKPASTNVGEGFLTSSLGLISENDNANFFDLLSLYPKKGFIELEIKEEIVKDINEIVFENFKLYLPPPIAFSNLQKIYGFHPRSVREKGFLTIYINNADIEVDDIKRFSKVIFSYLQGAEIYESLLKDKEKIKIYYYQSLKENQIFPLIPTDTKEENWVEDFIIKFYEYWNNLNSLEKEKLERIIINLVYAKTKYMIIENKVANLFLAFEIITEGKLEKNKLKDLLNIPLYDAKFIVSFRNKILHGYSFEEAIKEAFKEADKEKEKENSLFYSLKNNLTFSQSDDFIKVYLGIISILDKFILYKINYTGKWFNPINEFAEEYVNEILLEDEEVLKELENR